MADLPPVGPFVIKDCALSSLAAGCRAQTLRELRDQVRTVDINSIYYHFWGGLLRPHFDDPEFSNDFASWARHALHDSRLAERLAIIDPGAYDNLEAMRAELIEVLDEELDQHDVPRWASRENQFHFIMAQLVVFDTGHRVHRPEDFPDVIPGLSIGSIYYHVIDARRRTPQRVDDFRVWLEGFGDRYAGLVESLAAVDPYFTSLTELRATLARTFSDYFSGERSFRMNGR